MCGYPAPLLFLPTGVIRTDDPGRVVGHVRTGTCSPAPPHPHDEGDDLSIPIAALLAASRQAQVSGDLPTTDEEFEDLEPPGGPHRTCRPSQGATADALQQGELESDEIEDPVEESSVTEESDDSDETDSDDVVDTVGIGGRGGRGGHAGRGHARAARSPEHDETSTRVKRHRLWWTKGEGRTIDPMLNGQGYASRARLTLYGYTEKTPLQFFEHCWPPSMVEEIAVATTAVGSEIIRPGFRVSKGEMWLFLAEKGYMNIFPQEGPRELYWVVPDEDMDRCVYVDHKLGRHGHEFSRYREIERAFKLPTYRNVHDFFDPVRKLVDVWNENMHEALIPGPVLTVDESMGGWKGKGMPGLMTVPRKPTPTGREAHTTADAQTGVVVHYEMYEGKKLMEEKEFVDIAGKNPAKAMRCVKPWFGSGRVVILDSGFASVRCALHLMDKGIYMIGNVKTGHTQFPKAWLISQVPRRGDRAMCTAMAVSPNGTRVHLLGAADRDKQPMALLGTAGTTCEGETLFRVFTTIRADGTFNRREAQLAQMHIHEVYRKNFNSLDKHNAYRQGNHNLEESWHTKRWYVREFQVLWGMSEVNAWLLYRTFVPGAGKTSFTNFRKRLCFQMLRHPSWSEERMALRKRGGPGEALHILCKIGVSPAGVSLKRACVMCGTGSEHCCGCEPKGDMPGIPICNPSGRRPECHAKHVAGEKPPNRRSEAVANVWKRKREDNV